MITIIVGSTRPEAQSAKVGDYLEKKLKTLKPSLDTHVLDLFKLNLPLFTPENHKENKAWPEASERLKKSTAFIVISPEWDGMACPGLKNFFNYCHNKELFHKPALLTTVSAGRGGAYPIAELRMSSYKNSRVCYLPEHLIIRGVESVLNQEQPENDEDTHIRERINFALEMLLAYEKAFQSLPRDAFAKNPAFGNGM